MSLSVLIVGSAPMPLALLRAFAASADTIICADGGGDLVSKAGLVPKMVIGDMDSIGREARSRLIAADVTFVTHPTDKDKTDLELALDYAVELGPARIVVLGALGGGRLDHTIGNLLLLTQPALQEIDVRLVDESGEAFVVRSSARLAGTPGDYVSLLPLSTIVEGVVTTGLRFTLRGETLYQGSTRGVSNELEYERAVISVSAGLLLVRREGSVTELV